MNLAVTVYVMTHWDVKLDVFFNEGNSKMLWKNTARFLVYAKLPLYFWVSLLAVFDLQMMYWESIKLEEFLPFRWNVNLDRLK